MIELRMAGGQAAFSGWEKQVSTNCIRSGIRMIAEREGYHSRIFERRLADLGAECKAGLTDFGRKLTEELSDPKMSAYESCSMSPRLRLIRKPSGNPCPSSSIASRTTRRARNCSSSDFVNPAWPLLTL
ncbi:MAG: hypothetical protein IVW54_20915 [Candidatus Binataceae bacterium]|nr:hypothetical protein [Candidatus Binataceae bacterium]